MSHPSFIAADRLRAEMQDIRRELDEFKERDPEGFAAYIEQERQKAYRLTGRNPDGSRK